MKQPYKVYDEKVFDDISQLITNAYLLLEDHLKEVHRTVIEITRHSKDEDFVYKMLRLRNVHRKAIDDLRIMVGRYQEAICKILTIEQDMEIEMNRQKNKDGIDE